MHEQRLYRDISPIYTALHAPNAVHLDPTIGERMQHWHGPQAYESGQRQQLCYTELVSNRRL